MTRAVLAASTQIGLTSDPIDADRFARALRAAYRGISPSPRLLEAIWRRIGEAAGAAVRLLVDFYSQFSGAGRVIPWAVTVLAAFVGIWFGLQTARRLGIVPDTKTDSSDNRIQAVDWQAVAEEAIARGDLRSAARALYRQLVGTLVARGWIPGRPGLTAGECRLAVSGIPGVGPDVDRATRIFERVVYGDVTPVQADIDAMRQAERSALAA